ncbi:MAG: hypothetical protein IJ752_07715 [Alphaproteobacteria bacterium]|nr:hypothetical protein [Alphaproteobacteria bacterium]
MSGTVEEFMQGSVERYHCGREAQKAKKTLTQAFTASGEQSAAEEAALFEKIIDTVMLTPKGRETMTTLSELGYSFVFEKGNFGGLCSPDQKKIVVNPSFGFEYMLQTAVHEGRHAIQASLENPDRPNYENTQVASVLRKQRAIEADAVAHEMAFVYECKDILPKVYEEAKRQNLPMFQAYVGEMEKSHDEQKAMQASFAAWYDCDYYRDYYDKWHKDGVKQICEYGIQAKNADCFRDEYPVEDVLRMCCYKGKPYMTAEFLNTGRPFSVTSQDKREISAMIRDYVSAVPGAKPDRSVMTMRTRALTGELLPVQKDTAQTAALSSVLKQRGR